MKKVVASLLVLGFLFASVSNSFAKGPFITPGARAVGYGTAFTAVADDLTAIYYNPAGLAKQKNTQIMLTTFYIDYPATSNKKSCLMNLPGLGDVAYSDKYSTSAVVPFGAFSTPIYEDIIIALGVYAIGGGGGKVENLTNGSYVKANKVEGSQSFMVYNISFAKQIFDKFYLGLGFDAIEMKDKMVISTSVDAINCDFNRSSFGFQGNIGLMYDATEKMSLGFVLRSGTKIGLPVNNEMIAKELSNDSYSYPLTTELGIAYDLLEPLTVTAAVTYNTYSWEGPKYRNTFQFKVGSEYRATEKLSFHLGFFNDPCIYKNISDIKVHLINLNMYNMYYTTVGAEYAFNPSLKIGLSITHSFTQDVYYEGIRYNYDPTLGRFDISYKFL